MFQSALPLDDDFHDSRNCVGSARVGVGASQYVVGVSRSHLSDRRLHGGSDATGAMPPLGNRAQTEMNGERTRCADGVAVNTQDCV